ncbi:MAG: hypothetical protein AB1714_18005 [Acidobacteriota bacterium]
MNKKLAKRDRIEAIADAAQRGEDVSAHFSGKFQAKQRVNVDFPLPFLRLIDQECRSIGITRQAWIKMVCDERLREVYARVLRKRAS